MSDEIGTFRTLFWAARRGYTQRTVSEQYQKAWDYAGEHGLLWGQVLLDARRLAWQGDTAKAAEVLTGERADVPTEAYDLVLFIRGSIFLAEKRWDEAVKVLREAAECPTNDAPWSAWYNLGVALYFKGEHDEAINAYRKALQDPGNDTPGDAFYGIASALHDKGQYIEAIEAYNQALKEPKRTTEDGFTFVGLALAHQRAGHRDEAREALLPILERPEVYPAATTLAKALLSLIQSDLREESLSPEDRMVLQSTPSPAREGPEERVLAKMQSAEQTAYDEYMKRTDSNRDNVLSILRGWSSAVTLLEGSQHVWRGGGYFLKWRGKGIVIDPGFDFLRNFHDAGYHGREIDAVVVSHNHPDHNSDLKRIDDLRYELYKRRSQERSGSMGPYVLIWDRDTQASVKFSVEKPEHQYKTILFDTGRCEPCDTIAPPHGLPVSLEYFPVTHGSDLRNPVGFRLQLIGTEGAEFTLGYTGDTEYFPDLAERLSGCDLLIAHISQPEPEELSNPKARKKNHLGYRGIVELIRQCQPKATVVSEFWAGLADLRIDLVQGIRALTGNRAILPGGIGMHLHLPELQVECTVCGKKVAFQDVRVSPPSSKFGQLGYLCPDCMLG